MEQKSFFQRLKENPFSWLFSGELFFLTLNSLFLIVVLTAIISFIASFFYRGLCRSNRKGLSFKSGRTDCRASSWIK